MGYDGERVIRAVVRATLLALAVGAAIACSRGRAVPAPKKVQLARLPTSVGPIVVSDDARRYAYVEKMGGTQRVVRDGIPDESFAGCGGLTFSPVTQKLFYWAGSQTGYLVAEGARIGTFAREGTMAFSRDGVHWATAAGLAEVVGDPASPAPAVMVLADGKEVGRHPDASIPTFSPSGGHLAYLAATESGSRLIVDGTERATYPRPSAPCAAARKGGPKAPGLWPQFQTKYLSDGSLLVMTQDEDGWGIYRDAKRIAAYGMSLLQRNPTPGDDCAGVTGVGAWSLATAEKAPVAAWWERLAREKDAWRVVVNGRPADAIVCSRPWRPQPPELTPDGRHLAYACEVTEPEDRTFMVADGRRYGPYREISVYVWSDDGAHFAYAASEGEAERPWRYYVDGTSRTAAVDEVWRPRLEARTGRLLWEGRSDEEHGRGTLGIDRRRITSFDDVVWGPAELQRGIATWVIRRGRRLMRLDIPTTARR